MGIFDGVIRLWRGAKGRPTRAQFSVKTAVTVSPGRRNLQVDHRNVEQYGGMRRTWYTVCMSLKYTGI